MREVALVLPPDTWLTKLDGSNGKTADSASSTTAPATGPSPSGSTSSASAGKPRVKLEGCAIRQTDVAVLLVRLRRLHGVEDVELHESSRNETSGGGSSAGGGSESVGGQQGCGHDYKFDLTVTFKPEGADAPTVKGTEKVPTSLGGGS